MIMPLSKKGRVIFKRAEKALNKLDGRLSITFDETNHVPLGFNYDKESDIPSKKEMEALCILIDYMRFLISDSEQRAKEQETWDKLFGGKNLKR